MKAVVKGVAPPELTHFRSRCPRATWEEMRHDPYFEGQQAYTQIRGRLLGDQGGICAYCELDIRDNHPLKCRVEHFHPKSDTTSPKNWALDWNNLLAVCNGGSNEYVNTPGFFLMPKDENLSCDAHKDRMIQKGKLSPAGEGWILNPLQVNSFPNLFRVNHFSGRLEPDELACNQVSPIQPNNLGSTLDLVQKTIDMLNLNCARLCDERMILIRTIEQGKKEQRKKGFSPTEGLENLCKRYFHFRWPQFFSTIRFCLGQAAEKYLQEIGYNG
ncbi:MAG: TIGR02646 family protein [Deltaproteobacteria bacterium]|nr:TIGR02646 family protein [Deltaproteobacteria bacterium]